MAEADSSPSVRAWRPRGPRRGCSGRDAPQPCSCARYRRHQTQISIFFNRKCSWSTSRLTVPSTAIDIKGHRPQGLKQNTF